MKGLLLFTVETAAEPFVPQLVETLRAEQAKRRTLYHMEWVRVVIGGEGNGLRVEGDALLWQVDADAMGDITDDVAAGYTAQQLVTRLYARVCENQDTACNVVFLASDSVCSTAALHLAAIVQRRFVSLYSIKLHLILLQDQLTPFGDRRVWHMLETIKSVNSAPTRFYSSLYILPWETGKQKSSSATIVALLKLMVVGSENPMLVPQIGSNPLWVGTAAVTHLEAPVHEIARVIFQFLTDRFTKQVLEPIVQGTDSVLESSRGFDAHARVLRDMIGENVRTNQLMPLSELYEIMPLQDPTMIAGENEEMPRAETAWREIYRMFGDETGDSLKARLNPNLEQLEAKYAGLGDTVSRGLLKQSIELAAERGLGFEMLPQVMDTLGQMLMKESRGPAVSDMEQPNFKRGFLVGKETKAAVGIARTRQLYLRAAYNDVRKTYDQRHREVRQKTVEKAISDSRHHISNTLISLYHGFRQRCDIQLEQMPSGNFYSVRLRDVYTAWCQRQIDQLDVIAPNELYGMFTDDILAMPAEQAAEAICDQLIRHFNACTEKALDRIRIHISQFFKEISFRTSQLPNIGVSENLIGQLIDYMDRQTTVVPILFASAGEAALSTPKARAFVFHEVSGDSSHEFGQLALERSINVINDPFESGVEMIVKYAGNALDRMLLYLNNQPQDGLR